MASTIRVPAMGPAGFMAMGGDVMKAPTVTRCAMLGGIALALCAASGHAQVDTSKARPDSSRRDTTALPARSTMRIPIRKESRGEVSLPPGTGSGAGSSARVSSIARDSAMRADSITNASKARNDSILVAGTARNDSLVDAERLRADSRRARTRDDSLAMAARTDSIARAEQARTDSISLAEHARADSVTRVDSAAGQAMVTDQGMHYTAPHRFGRFYLGIAAGAAAPLGDVSDLGYDRGYDVTVPIGWQEPGNRLGLRLALGYTQWNGEVFAGGAGASLSFTNPDPKIYSAAMDLTLRFPLNEDRTSSVYLLGGGGLYVFSNFGRGSALGGYLGNDVVDPDNTANRSTIRKWGVNGGAGVEYGVGTASIFLESRLVNVFTGRGDDAAFTSVFGSGRSNQVRWLPVVLGVTIR